MNGAPVSLASRRAISVLPTPVGPIIMMFFGRHFLAHVALELLAAPAVADGHGHGPLRRVLADDVPIEFFNDLPRGQVSHVHLLLKIALRTSANRESLSESVVGILAGSREPHASAGSVSSSMPIVDRERKSSGESSDDSRQGMTCSREHRRNDLDIGQARIHEMICLHGQLSSVATDAVRMALVRIGKTHRGYARLPTRISILIGCPNTVTFVP